MAEISRAVLFGELNPLAYKAIEGATVFCQLRDNPYVELQHWISQILVVTPKFWWPKPLARKWPDCH